MNVLLYQFLYFAICPFIAIYEIAIAGRSSLTRDFRRSLASNHANNNYD